MITGKQLHGLQVISKDGTTLGVIDEVIAKKNNGRVVGFLISNAGLFNRSHFIPADKIIDIGLSGLIITNKDSIQKIKKYDSIPDNTALKMNDLSTNKGHVTDVIVENNQIKEVELSQGIVNDIKNGRQRVPWDKL